MGYHEDLTGNAVASKVDRQTLALPIKWWTKTKHEKGQYIVSIMCRINDARNQSPEKEELSFVFGREQLAKSFKQDQGNMYQFINGLSLVKQQAEKHRRNVNRMLLEVKYSDLRVARANVENYHGAVERMKKIDCYTELHRMARNLAFLEMINSCHGRDELYKISTSNE